MEGLCPHRGDFYKDEELTVTATPDSGYKFVGWSDGINELTRTIPITQDLEITANFEPLSLEES